eukprot:CAMPEP_0117055678 /NCGR_PEP_ID=MMETSP0472-20121206/38622_1 /TAXON_ID=693140 ORGANISM="Tiarina fusus, Strain LIS" /NCGR_SAMPLE_ID=MMETSP0472 /ASSEMBLY_ACC=CAM_ASM_000603 /LENGTH=65 /DNA_ID=CAMNT_0004771815 /DNA_START=26 /DNA_END=223 /DNA_ORIENTATION=-
MFLNGVPMMLVTRRDDFVPNDMPYPRYEGWSNPKDQIWVPSPYDKKDGTCGQCPGYGQDYLKTLV